VVVEDPELYAYDGEILDKAKEMGYPGLISIKQRQDQFLFKVEGTGALPVRRGKRGGGGVEIALSSIAQYQAFCGVLKMPWPDMKWCPYFWWCSVTNYKVILVIVHTSLPDYQLTPCTYNRRPAIHGMAVLICLQVAVI
jgi:hypothetical protein